MENIKEQTLASYGVKGRLPAFWALQFFGWGVYGFNKYLAAPHQFDKTFIALLLGFGMTTGLRYLYKWLWSRSVSALSLVVLAFFCSVLSGCLWPLEVESIFWLLNEAHQARSWFDTAKATLSLPLVVNRLWVFPVWSALYFGLKAWRDLQQQKERALRATALAHQAQLELLRYQLNPHFLFNSLNSIRALIDEDPARARKMVTAFSEFLRYSLLNANASKALLRDEIEAIRNYLEIEKIRFEDRLEVSFDIAPQAENCHLPGFLIHPLVENAIKYGMQTSPAPLKIGLTARVNNGSLRIKVSNTGSWVAANKLASSNGTGLGLENVRQRLEQIFPGRHRFSVAEAMGLVSAVIEIDQNPGS